MDRKARVASMFQGSVPPSEMDEGAFAAFVDRAMAVTQELIGENIDEKITEGLPQNVNELGIEPFGIDRDTVRLSAALLSYFYRWWFRVEVEGVDSVPDGRVLLVSNHAGQVPVDGMMIAVAMILDKKKPRFTRAMVERFIQEMPFLSVWFPRVGQVLGTPENAKRLLEAEEALCVFPEGVRGISKTFDQRYKLAPFGQGFMRLALETKCPIVPVAVIGNEEQYPAVTNLDGLARILGLPSLPVIPQLFVGMLLPLPTKYRIYFGEPLYFTGDPDDEDAVIDEKVWQIRATVQSMVNRGVKERKAIFW